MEGSRRDVLELGKEAAFQKTGTSLLNSPWGGGGWQGRKTGWKRGGIVQRPGKGKKKGKAELDLARGKLNRTIVTYRAGSSVRKAKKIAQEALGFHENKDVPWAGKKRNGGVDSRRQLGV